MMFYQRVVPFLSMRPNAFVPQYATEGSAAVDLHAYINPELGEFVRLRPGDKVLVPTGIAIQLPHNVCAMILPRSGNGHKHGIVLGNTVGLIDTDYRGEIMVSLMNTGSEVFHVAHGDRIAQMLFLPWIQADLKPVAELEHTSRGTGGFGHTGGGAS